MATALAQSTPAPVVAQLTSTAGTAVTPIYSAPNGGNGVACTSLFLVNQNLSTPYNFTLFKTRSGTNYLMNAVTLPAAAGFPTAPSIDVFGSVIGMTSDGYGNHVDQLLPGDGYAVQSSATVSQPIDIFINCKAYP